MALTSLPALAVRPDSSGNAHLAKSNPFRDGLKHLRKLGTQDLVVKGEDPGQGRVALAGDAGAQILRRLNARLQTGGGEARVRSTQIDGKGNRHIRVDLFHRGYPVIGGDAVIHVNAENEVYAVGGSLAEGLAPATTAKLKAKDASAAARQGLGHSSSAVEKQAPRLVIFDGALAYETQVEENGPTPHIWRSYLDANTGELLFREDRIVHAVPVGGAASNVTGSILTGEGGGVTNINGWRDSLNHYFLRNNTALWGVFDEDSNDWSQNTTGDWGTTDRAAVSLAKNFEITQNYVSQVLGRNSYNDAGAFATGNVHAGANMANAFWDGASFHFGDGNGIEAGPMTTLDVASHEYGHAITQYTSNLNYSYESGALNESFSDILGVAVEFWAQPDGRSAYPAGQDGRSDWLEGEDCWLSGEAIRDLRNPGRFGQPSYYQGTNWVTGAGDNGGVHTNSGVQNFAFYLLSEGGSGSNDGHPYAITGLGYTVASEIAWYANMYLLTSGSRYGEAREAWVLAATSLGYNAQTVQDVWTACGVLEQVNHLTVSPASLAFGPSGVGAPADLNLILSNHGAVSTTVTGLVFDNPAFTSSASLPLTVPVGVNVTVSLRFQPTALGPVSGNLTLASNADESPILVVPLSGTGVTPASATLAPNGFTLSLAMGQAPADRTSTLSNVVNAGGDNLDWRIASIQQTGSPVPPVTAAPASVLPLVRTDLIYAKDNYSRPYVPGRVIVGYMPGKNGFASSLAAAASGIKQMQELARAIVPKTGRKANAGRKVVLLTLQDANGVRQAIDLLRKDANVAYAEPDYIQETVALPNDPSFGLLDGMRNTGQNDGTVDADIDAPEAWDRHTGNRSILIGVLDTGIDYLHPDLAANIWTNPGEIAANGIDDDGNGFIDDMHGWDFGDDDNDPTDRQYHGTHVSGTLAAVGNNGVGVAGVMWTASLVALKSFPNSGVASTSDAVDALNYANAMGVRITNNSWGGGGFSQALMDAIAAGGLFVAGAGNNSVNNDFFPFYPSSYPLDNVIAVAATDNLDNLADISNFGHTTVHLGAPGVNIYSTVPGNGYRTLTGTSMATPHVSGAAGLVWSLHPTMTAAQVKATLLASTDPIPALDGRSVTGGRLNARRALDAAKLNWLTASPMTPGILAPGESTPITVTVDPAGLVAGRWTGLVNVSTDDPAHPVLPISVTADIAGCRSLTVDSLSHDFGDQYVGFAARTLLTLRNACNDTVKVLAVSSSNPAFSLAGSLPIKVPPFQILSVPAEFLPSAVGPASGTLSLTSDADTNPMKTVSLLGQGVLPPHATVTPASVSRTLARGATTVVDLDIGNSGGSDLLWSLTPVSRGSVSPAAPDIRVGPPVTEAVGGPDEFGYQWTDSDQPGGPVYQWQDISATGALVLSGCDDCNDIKPLSFAFPIYGNRFSQVNITSNGWVNFGLTDNKRDNFAIPDTRMPGNMVAGFFDDLSTYIGGVYFQDFGDRAVIQYQNVGYFQGAGTVTFQIVLHSDGEIDFYYENMTGLLHSSTTGIQNGSGSVGLQVSYYTPYYIKNHLAVRIRNLPDWLRASEISGTVPAGGSRRLALTLDAGWLTAGNYTHTMTLASNHPLQAPISIPVDLSVTGDTGVSRVFRVGPSALELAAGSRYSLWNASVGGETRGLLQGSLYTLYLK